MWVAQPKALLPILAVGRQFGRSGGAANGFGVGGRAPGPGRGALAGDDRPECGRVDRAGRRTLGRDGGRDRVVRRGGTDRRGAAAGERALSALDRQAAVRRGRSGLHAGARVGRGRPPSSGSRVPPRGVHAVLAGGRRPGRIALRPVARARATVGRRSADLAGARRIRACGITDGRARGPAARA